MRQQRHPRCWRRPPSDPALSCFITFFNGRTMAQGQAIRRVRRLAVGSYHGPRRLVGVGEVELVGAGAGEHGAAVGACAGQRHRPTGCEGALQGDHNLGHWTDVRSPRVPRSRWRGSPCRPAPQPRRAWAQAGTYGSSTHTTSSARMCGTANSTMFLGVTLSA
jgi:hypothetical protein